MGESGLFYLRCLVNDHPILGSPFKVRVESTFNEQLFDDNEYKSDSYYVINNLSETWKNPKNALRGRKNFKINIKPRSVFDKFNDFCTIFVPENVWEKLNMNDKICVITNEAKTKCKAVKCIKIENEIEEKKEENEEDKDKDKE